MRAYDAERKVFARRRRVLTMQEARDLSAKLFAHFGVEPIVVERTRGGRADSWSHYWHPRPKYPLGFIRLSNCAADWLVCHEVAHYVAFTRGHRGHGPAWVEVYVEAVRIAVSDHYADRLALAMRRCGVTR